MLASDDSEWPEGRRAVLATQLRSWPTLASNKRNAAANKALKMASVNDFCIWYSLGVVFQS